MRGLLAVGWQGGRRSLAAKLLPQGQGLAARGAATATWQKQEFPRDVGAAEIAAAAAPSETPEPGAATTPSQDAMVKFGKYRGSSIKEVFEKDRRYCLWVVQEAKREDAGHGMQAMAREVRPLLGLDPGAGGEGALGLAAAARPPPQGPLASWAHGGRVGGGRASPVDTQTGDSPPLSTGERQVAFGKYKDRSFAEVFSADQQYCDWLVNKKVNEGGESKDNNANVWMFIAYVLHKRLEARGAS